MTTTIKIKLFFFVGLFVHTTQLHAQPCIRCNEQDVLNILAAIEQEPKRYTAENGSIFMSYNDGSIIRAWEITDDEVVSYLVLFIDHTIYKAFMKRMEEQHPRTNKKIKEWHYASMKVTEEIYEDGPCWLFVPDNP